MTWTKKIQKSTRSDIAIIMCSITFYTPLQIILSRKRHYPITQQRKQTFPPHYSSSSFPMTLTGLMSFVSPYGPNPKG